MVGFISARGKSLGICADSVYFILEGTMIWLCSKRLGSSLPLSEVSECGHWHLKLTISHSQYRKHAWSDYDSSTKCQRNQSLPIHNLKGFSKNWTSLLWKRPNNHLTIFTFPLSWRFILIPSRHKLHRQLVIHFKFFPSHTDFDTLSIPASEHRGRKYLNEYRLSCQK